MFNVTIHEIKEVAELAGFTLDDRTLGSLIPGVLAMVRCMDCIQALDVTNIPSTVRLTEEKNVWREDAVEKSLSRAQLSLNGHMKKGYFIAPSLRKPL